jgi:hypothetical protein
MRDAFKGFIDAGIKYTEIATITGALVDFLLLFLPEVGIFVALLVGGAEALITAGADALTDNFTEEVYDEIQCAFYCHIGGDGTVTDEQKELVRAQVEADQVTFVSALFDIYTFIVGSVGFQNSGATGTETGDCSDCACGWCYTFDFTASDGGWFIRSTDEGVYSPGDGWQTNCFTLDGTAERVVIQYDFGSWGSATLTEWEAHFDYLHGDSGIQQFVMRQFSGAAGTGSVLAITSEVPPPNGDQVGSGSGSITPGSMELNIWTSSGDCTGSCNIFSVTLRGTGDNPFGDDNCV